MDEDEAKSIASDWIRRLEASLLAKVSNEHDNTTPGDQIYHHHHQNDSVSNSFSRDDFEAKHIDITRTSSDEKINHETTGLLNGKDLIFQEEDITKIESRRESGSKTLINKTKNDSGSPRIDLEDLRRKRLERFENITNSSEKISEDSDKYLSCEKTFFADSTSEDSMLRYEATSLGIEGNSLRDNQWKSNPCSFEAISTNNDEDDKLRLELWGLRGAVESGQLDIDSYLGPLYSRTNKNSSLQSENGFKEEPYSSNLEALDNSSSSKYYSSNRDKNFNIKRDYSNPDIDFTNGLRDNRHGYSTWKTGNEWSKRETQWKSSFSPRSDINGIANVHHCDSKSREDFTSFSVTKPSGSSGNNGGPWLQIQGKLYNGFETSDSESSVSALNVPHKNKSKTSHEKSDFRKPDETKSLKSGKGKQKILNELTEFLDSERSSKRVAKESARKTQYCFDKSRLMRSPVPSEDNLSDSLLPHKEPSLSKMPDLLPNVDVGDSVSPDSQHSETNFPKEKNGNLDLLSSVSQEKSTAGSTLEEMSTSSGTQMAKVCKICHEINSKAANWCIECGTALIKVEPVLLTLEQQSKYEDKCQETKNLIADALTLDVPLKNGSISMSKAEKNLYQDVLHLSKEVDKNTGFSNESLRSNLCNYKRRWLKSSVAWSSFEPQELSKPLSILKSNGKENQMEMNRKKESKNLRSRSSSDLSAIEGHKKKHATKNGHSKGGGRRRTTSANYHSADDYEARNNLSISIESSNQERPVRSKVRPGSAKPSSKSKRTKPQRKRPESAKPRTYSQSSSPDQLSIEKEEETNERESESNGVYIPQLNLDDVGGYDRILTLIRSQRDCDPVPYLYLPEEIILQIFSNLSIKDKVSCAQVCWQFHRIAMDETLWKNIVIRKNRKINDGWLESIGDRHPTSLTISQCSGNSVTADGLRSLFRKCSSTLEEVDFSGCSGGELIGESILLHIAARCSGVVSVDVSWTNVSDNGVEALAENVTRLQCLCLNGCQAITDKSLTCVAKKHGESLRIFEVFGCFNITPASLQLFANQCVKLQTLNIGQCHKMTDGAIGNLVSHLPELENLDLRGCKQARDSSVKKIVRHCPHLTSLVLANCPLITDVTLSEISTNLPGIKSLDICGCANITDAGVRALARCCHKLELLDLSSTGNSVTSKSIVSLGNYCSQSLQVLKLSFCADITVHTVNQLAKNCKKLRLLHLYGCKRIKEHEKLKNVNPRLVIEK